MKSQKKFAPATGGAVAAAAATEAQLLTIDGEANPLLHEGDPTESPVFHSAADGPAVVLWAGPELEGVGRVPGLLPVLLQPGGHLIGVL